MAYTLQELSDIEDIKKCKATYFRAIDLKDWDTLEDCFTPDIKFEMITPQDGWSNMSDEPGRDAYMKNLKICIGNARTSHQGHCQNVTLTSDTTADSWTALEDRLEMYDMGFTQLGQAYYKERYIKGDDGKWRIDAMSIRYLRVKYTPFGEPTIEPEDSEYEDLPDYDALSKVFAE